ncbi:hypothetical protein [Enterococcus cecorum]|uniref:hypothetical protein n=1 Tax=Enterococcus cecorum TaxID=44008 RepID=UPI000DEB7388|nr:hypothetical protein [Enterococcus cecorum]RBR36066.1 hypothetical protein EB26_00888 [Enterococcus cecorum]
MKSNVLMAKLKLLNKNIDWLVTEMAKVGEKTTRSTVYKKLRGESEFTAGEIKAISQVMELSPDEIMDIFFVELVS